MTGDSLAPSRLPDLFADRPCTVYGRYQGDHDSIRIRVHGVDAEGKPWEQEAVGRSASNDVLSSLWGRAKVRELEDRYAAGTSFDPKTLAKQIVDVSLESHVLSLSPPTWRSTAPRWSTPAVGNTRSSSRWRCRQAGR